MALSQYDIDIHACMALPLNTTHSVWRPHQQPSTLPYMGLEQELTFAPMLAANYPALPYMGLEQGLTFVPMPSDQPNTLPCPTWALSKGCDIE
jgi:hypothetical protein